MANKWVDVVPLFVKIILPHPNSFFKSSLTFLSFFLSSSSSSLSAACLEPPYFEPDFFPALPLGCGLFLSLIYEYLCLRNTVYSS